MALSEEDYNLIMNLRRLAIKIEINDIKDDEKAALSSFMTQFSEDGKSAYVDADLTLAWKYLLYGWVVSQYIDQENQENGSCLQASQENST